MRQTQTQSANLPVLVCIVTNYLFVILNCDTSNFLPNEVFHYFDMDAFCCQVQRSHLIRRKKLYSKPIRLNFHAKKLVCKLSTNSNGIRTTSWLFSFLLLCHSVMTVALYTTNQELNLTSAVFKSTNSPT